MADYVEARDDDEEFYAHKVQRKRRFRGVVASVGCLGLAGAWVLFTGWPVIVLAWRYWFGAGQ